MQRSPLHRDQEKRRRQQLLCEPDVWYDRILKKGDFKVNATPVDNDGMQIGEPKRPATVPATVDEA